MQNNILSEGKTKYLFDNLTKVTNIKTGTWFTVEEVKNICNFKSSINGGRGAVRELCDFILDSQGIEKIPQVSEGENK